MNNKINDYLTFILYDSKDISKLKHMKNIENGNKTDT